MYANSDASGTFDVKTAQDANDRMRAAGVHVLSMFAVSLELMRDWRNTPGAPEMMPFFDQWVLFSTFEISLESADVDVVGTCPSTGS